MTNQHSFVSSDRFDRDLYFAVLEIELILSALFRWTCSSVTVRP